MRTWLLLFLFLLAACAGRTVRAPLDGVELRLPPAGLGRSLAAQQQLTFVFGKDQRSLDALLEIDANAVSLAVDSAGQSAMRLRWDGHRFEQQRAPWLPPSLRAERVLSDLQLALWPLEQIRAALPTGWTLTEEEGVRRLSEGGQLVETVRFLSPVRTEIEAHREGFRLIIVSTTLPEPTP